MRKISGAAIILLSVMVAAIYLPKLYENIFYERIAKTHLLFSPVEQQFIYKEKIVGNIPPEAVLKAEDHHAEIAYRDADGNYFTRVEFEKKLPFIYYKNMELWGLLPLRFGDKSFDKADIKKNRQVFELRHSEINGNQPQVPLWPLLESNPDQARLVFPEDRFRMTTDAMEFINADYNIVDKVLTERFTSALKRAGFVFPARSVNGKFTILKPFDEGVFLVDDTFHVFHLKRKNGDPIVVKTSIDPKLKTRHIKISENKRKEYYGLLLDGTGQINLLTYDNYRLVPLPLKDYDSGQMDFKLIMNPLYKTAVYSDENIIRAVAMDEIYQPVKTFSHTMSRSKTTAVHRFYKIIFPFSIHLDAGGDDFMKLSVQSGGFAALIGIACCLGCYMLTFLVRRKKMPPVTGCALVSLTGVFGLLAVHFVGSED